MKQRVQAKHEGKLLEFLLGNFPEINRTRLKQYLRHACVSVNHRVTTRFDHPVKPGDEVGLETSKARAVTPALQFHIQRVYEDDAVILIHKPAGLLTIATDKIQRETAIFSVNDYLNKRAEAGAPRRKIRSEKRVFIVHRLDRDVSGLLLFAKNEAAKFKLQENWGQFTKEYDAIVEGCPAQPSGTISNFLAENKILKVYASDRPKSPGAKKAVTHYEAVKAGKFYSHLKVRLETGRRHQIRVHLAGLGCPVAGDKLYGARTDPAGRIALHASRLSFLHPVSGKKLEFTSPLPPALVRLSAA